MIIDIKVFEYRPHIKELYLDMRHDISDPIEEEIKENVTQGKPITIQGVTKNVNFKHVRADMMYKDVHKVVYESDIINVRLLFLVKWTVTDSLKPRKYT